MFVGSDKVSVPSRIDRWFAAPTAFRWLADVQEEPPTGKTTKIGRYRRVNIP